MVRMLDCGGRGLDLSRPRIMGILNVTPDSFSDGGDFVSPAAALERARKMAAEGADLIDVGGESTRPGAPPVPVEEELARVVPVIEAIARELPLPISIDTSKPEVMRAAVAAGAGMINDVYALRREGALAAAAELGARGVAVCLMHMQGEPRTMQQAPQYQDVVAEVTAFMEARIAACEAAGIPRHRLILDPGFGFGKTLQHNLTLLRRLGEFQTLGLPLLVGLSRKSMIGALLDGAPVEGRLHGSIAAAILAAGRGAAILRVHDVGPTAEALRVTQAVLGMDAEAVGE
jgi:dihydropteroate synthase